MATISGKLGKVQSGGSDIDEVTKWNLKLTDSAPSYCSSSTGGWKTRRSGVNDGTGTFDAKLNPTASGKPPVGQGSAVTLNLYLNASLFFIVPALISDMDYTTDIDTGEVIGYTASFGVTGAVTLPTYP